MSLLSPNVPSLPGVPSLLNGISAAKSTPQLLLNADAISNLFSIFSVKWGIFSQSGAPILTGHSVIAFGNSSEYKISDYPIEQGGFSSYNKVKIPYEVKVQFAVDGTVSNRSAFITNAENLLASLSVVNVVSPDKTYINANVVKVSYDRTRANGGASLIMFDVFCREVRVSSSADFSSTVDPSAQDAQVQGSVQAANDTVPAAPSPTAIPQVDLPPPSTTPAPVVPPPTATPPAATPAPSTTGGQNGYVPDDQLFPSSTTPVSPVASPGYVPQENLAPPDPQVPNVPPSQVIPSTLTGPDGAQYDLTTYVGVQAGDPILTTPSPTGEPPTIRESPDGSFTVTYGIPAALAGQANQTITPRSPNASVAR